MGDATSERILSDKYVLRRNEEERERKGRRRVSEPRRASRLDETRKSGNERVIGGKSYVSEGQLWRCEVFTVHVRETETQNGKQKRKEKPRQRV